MKSLTFGRSRAKTAPAATATRLIDPSTLPEKGIHFHMNHLRRLWKRGDFPEPLHISKRKIAWPEKVIDDWIAAKIAEAEQKKSA